MLGDVGGLLVERRVGTRHLLLECLDRRGQQATKPEPGALGLGERGAPVDEGVG